MNVERKFEDLGVDAIVGSKLMSLLEISTDDFVDESRFLRFKDVIGFFKDVPDMDYIINKISIGKNVDRLNHVWTFTELQKQKNDFKGRAESVMQKIDTLESLGDEFHKSTLSALSNELAGIQVQVKKIDEQIDKYN